MAVLVRSSSFLRIRSTSEVAREAAGGRNRLLARLCLESNFQMEVQGCACGEAAGSSGRQMANMILKRNARSETLSYALSNMVGINSGHKGCNAKAFCKKIGLIRVGGFPFHMGRGLPGDGAGVASTWTRLAPILTFGTVSVSSGTEFNQKLELRSQDLQLLRNQDNNT